MTRLFALFAVLMVAGNASAQPVQPKPIESSRVAAFLDGMFSAGMEQNRVAGATVAVVQDGRVLVARGYGTARLTPQVRAVGPDTLFQVASISKTPVYLAIMQLAEAGKLSLDDPVNAHLPRDLRIPDQGFGKPILIRHLMTHSAGFEDSVLGHLFVADPARLTTFRAWLKERRVRRVREAGERVSYSNYSTTLLGAIIERTSGIDFATYMETRVLRPLGMTTATYRYPIAATLAARLGLPAAMSARVQPFTTQQLGGQPGRWRLRPRELGANLPAGGLWASANDMAAYALALAEPARMEAAGVLRRASFMRLLEPGIALPGVAHTGFARYDLGGGLTGFGHGGSMLFGASDLVIVPELRLGIFVSSNGRGGFAFVPDVIRRLTADLAPRPILPAVRTDATLAAARAVAGAWVADRRAFARTERAFLTANVAFDVSAFPNGDLLVSPFAGVPAIYRPLGGGAWESATDARRLIFAKDAGGRDALWSGNGLGTSARATVFERPVFALGLLALTFLVAAALVVGRALRRRTDRAGWALSAAALAWTIGIGGFFAIAASGLPDGGAALVLGWPGAMPIIAWTIAAAVALTLVAALLAFRARQNGWHSAPPLIALLLFATASVAAWNMGLVGWSGF